MALVAPLAHTHMIAIGSYNHSFLELHKTALTSAFHLGLPMRFTGM